MALSLLLASPEARFGPLREPSYEFCSDGTVLDVGEIRQGARLQAWVEVTNRGDSDVTVEFPAWRFARRVSDSSLKPAVVRAGETVAFELSRWFTERLVGPAERGYTVVSEPAGDLSFRLSARVANATEKGW
jgi:hypothetical protein